MNTHCDIALRVGRVTWAATNQVRPAVLNQPIRRAKLIVESAGRDLFNVAILGRQR